MTQKPCKRFCEDRVPHVLTVLREGLGGVCVVSTLEVTPSMQGPSLTHTVGCAVSMHCNPVTLQLPHTYGAARCRAGRSTHTFTIHGK
jgi:hypothetical protein